MMEAKNKLRVHRMIILEFHRTDLFLAKATLRNSVYPYVRHITGFQVE